MCLPNTRQNQALQNGMQHLRKKANPQAFAQERHMPILHGSSQESLCLLMLGCSPPNHLQDIQICTRTNKWCVEGAAVAWDYSNYASRDT
jgi:hypothetical protein